MKTTPKRRMIFEYRYQIRMGYDMVPGYARKGQNWAYPRAECEADARSRGCVAVFQHRDRNQSRMDLRKR